MKDRKEDFCWEHKIGFLKGTECPKCIKYSLKNITPPSIADGKDISKNGVVSNNHRNGCKITEKVVNLKGMVVELHRGGCTQVDIASRFGVSQQYVSKILKSFSRNNPMQRFHNFSLSYDCDFDYVVLPFREVFMKNTSYKLFRDSEFHIQIFMNGVVVVRLLNDIVHNNIFKTNLDVVHYITKFLSSWNKFNIVFKSYRVSSVHNALTDNAVAMDVIGKGQDIKYFDLDDGKLRTEVDLSHGVPELEHEHPKHTISDSGKWERIIGDVATNNYFDLSVTKDKLLKHDSDFVGINSVLDRVNSNLIEQNKVTLLEIDNKKLHMEVLHDIKDSSKEQKDVAIEMKGLLKKQNSMFSKLLKSKSKKSSRKDKILRFKKRFS